MSDPSSARARYQRNLASLRAAQKSPQGTAAYGRFVNRPAGRRVTALVHLTGMTPNAATVVSAALSTAGIVVLATLEPTVLVGATVAVLLAAGYVMDSVDGQLARLRGGGSVSGEWLDHTIDCFKTSLLHLAVLVSWYRFPPTDATRWLAVPLLYEVVQVVTFFGLILMPFLRDRHRTAAPPQAEPPPAQTPSAPSPSAPSPSAGAEHPLRAWAILPTDYGALCWSFVLLGWPVGFLTVYSALAAANALALAYGLRKWWRELVELDKAPQTAPV